MLLVVFVFCLAALQVRWYFWVVIKVKNIQKEEEEEFVK